MNRVLKVIAFSCCVSLWFYTGCSNSDEPTPVDCSATDLAISLVDSDDPTGCGFADGRIEVTATGGDSPYKFSISDGPYASQAIFEDLGNGIFTIAVKDKNGCRRLIDVTLHSPDAPEIDPVIANDFQCLPPHDGSITINATGGTGSYEYKLEDGDFGTTSTFTALEAGHYLITVKDDADCEVIVNATVPKGITGIDFDGDILPIFEVRCKHSGCHPENGDWLTYSVAKANALKIKAQTANGNMPKDPQPGGDLTESEKAMIACWVNDGAPKTN